MAAIDEEATQRHDWKVTGLTIDTNPSFSEKVCQWCGTLNWGGKEDGVCPGKRGPRGLTTSQDRSTV